MLIQGFRKDKDIIEVYDDEVVQILSKYFVNYPLEGSGGVGKSEGHDEVLVLSHPGSKRYFPFISLFDTDQVIRSFQVQRYKP
jgi:hypothetical protein